MPIWGWGGRITAAPSPILTFVSTERGVRGGRGYEIYCHNINTSNCVDIVDQVALKQPGASQMFGDAPGTSD